MPTHDFSRWKVLSLLNPQITSTIQLVVVFGGGNGAILKTKDDKVYVIGLGQNFSEPLLVENLSNIDIIDVQLGWQSMFVVLTKGGHVYNAGQKNNFPSAGVFFVAEPTIRILGILEQQHIVKISCGCNHVVAVSQTGEVFLWGSDGSGQDQIINQQHINHKAHQRFHFISPAAFHQNLVRKIDGCLSGKFIKNVECGYNWTIVLSDDLELYSWGYNGYGQLGIGNKVNQGEPCLVVGLKDVKVSLIACGANHSLMLSADGQLYAWGCNGQGQLGIDTLFNIQQEPAHTAVELGQILNIGVSNRSNFSFAVTKANEVYVWGSLHGQNFVKPHLTNYKTIDDAFSCLSEQFSRSLFFDQPSNENNLHRDIKNSFDDPKTSDITFLVEGRPIYVHKAILKIRCAHFRLMDLDKKQIEIPQFTYPVYRAFLYHIYSEEINVTADSAVGLLDLANTYGEEELKSKCTNEIHALISVENVILLYDASQCYNAKDLEEFCFNFCMEHMTAVTQSEQFQKLDEVTFKHFIALASQKGAFKT